MKPKFSLRTAIIIPYMIVMLIMAFAVVWIWQSNYQFLAEEQGTRMVRVLSDHTNERINKFMGEPHRLNAVYAAFLSQNTDFTQAQIDDNQSFTLDFVKGQRQSLSQISVASYGDEDARYIGYRVNDDGTYTLMRKDEATNQMLNIYEGETVNSKVLAAYEGYDPRTRPWYAPVKSNPVAQWSGIYINIDEKNESTISTIMPIVGKNGVFSGVAELDVKLNGIHQFLEADTTRGTGVIYIVDREWNLVAHSGTAPTMKVIPGDTPTAELLSVTETEDPVIKSSADLLRKQDMKFNQASRVLLTDRPYYLLANEIDPNLNLGWKIIVAIPESDIMGRVKSNLNVSIIVMFVIILSGSLMGIIMMRRVTKPMLQVAHAAVDLSEGKWGLALPLNKYPLSETFELVTAFNRMSLQIKDMIEQVQDLHTQEKERLEEAISIKTQELNITMKELIDREKLASLGSLVSGISHEINTPLGVSVTAASYMEETNDHIQGLIQSNEMTKSDFIRYIETMRESVTILNTNLARASELIKSFKEIAVNQSIEEEMNFDIHEYIQSVIISLKHEYKHTKHQFIVDCPQPMIVYSYPGAWSQILTNFIMNSLQHGFREMDNGEITIKVHQQGTLLSLSYSDNGIGIPASNIAHVFDPFYTTNRGAGGSGLGLNIVYNLVTGRLRGKIAIKSTEMHGVNFNIEIPLNLDKSQE